MSSLSFATLSSAIQGLPAESLAHKFDSGRMIGSVDLRVTIEATFAEKELSTYHVLPFGKTVAVPGETRVPCL